MRVRVLLPLPLDGCFDYCVEATDSVRVGQLLDVPFGSQRLTGCVWATQQDGQAQSSYRGALRQAQLLAGFHLDAHLRSFIDWSASWTCSPRGGFLRMALGGMRRLRADKPVYAYHPVPEAERQSLTAMTKAQAAALCCLKDKAYQSKRALALESRASLARIEALLQKGYIVKKIVADNHALSAFKAELTEAQKHASGTITATAQQGFNVCLLQGATGAGKTWVYFDQLRRCLADGRQGLVLLPEIMLTQRWLAHCRAVLGCEPCVWHSNLGQAARIRLWHRLMRGEGRIVVGARSALFLPFKQLGLIVVDEEHDAAYKQEEGMVYHARDLAIARAQRHGITAILVSATPSLESYHNAQKGRYRHIRLPQRFKGAALPEVACIDMNNETLTAESFLSPRLVTEMKRCLARREQVLLFLNRRGYAPLTVCRRCGYWLTGPRCRNRLVQHRYRPIMLCHYCGYQTSLPRQCPSCHARDDFRACGPGVDRLEEEVCRHFPQAGLAILASDRLTDLHAMATTLRAIENHEVDIVIGTQVSAKGHHFPLLTLVGIVDADAGVGGYAVGDLRASERMFQLLHQVSGRAGRETRLGKVLVQSYMPQDYVLQALINGDVDGFLRHEMQLRAEWHLPPFGRLAAILLAARNDALVRGYAHALAEHFPHQNDVQLLGPSRAPINMIRGYHRWRLLVKSRNKRPLAPMIRQWLAAVTVPANMRLRIDIDPQSFF